MQKAWQLSGIYVLLHMCWALERTGHALQLLTRGIRVSVKQRLSILNYRAHDLSRNSALCSEQGKSTLPSCMCLSWSCMGCVSAGMGDCAGRKANPLADLPRWRVEMLVGTFVLDMSLYRRALTAPSAVPDSIKASYERLEYLGDGVLEGIIRHFIYTRCDTLGAAVHIMRTCSKASHVLIRLAMPQPW